MLDKKRLQELVKEVDPNEQLDEDVEELLLHIADDFIEQVGQGYLNKCCPKGQNWMRYISHSSTRLSPPVARSPGTGRHPPSTSGTCNMFSVS